MRESKEFDPASTDPLLEETTHFQRVLKLIRHQLSRFGPKLLEVEDEEDNDEALTADEIAEATVEHLQKERLRSLRIAEREPYFGRIDFVETGEERVQALYIGKRGIDNPETADRIVLDWRSPAASLFYSFTGQGDTAEYEAPEGTVEGTVVLKRNIVIRDAELQRVVDSYVQGQDHMAVTDEFLVYRLAENKDSRLRDIVSSIQAEQNEIIRADRNRAVVIQGVAGSGKTTVALHRLAYLLYQHQDRMRADRMAIFAPNAMFVNYISEVLPELGVGGIQQTTFAQWALRILDYRVGLADLSHRMRDWFGIKEAGVRRSEYRDVEAKGNLQLMQDLDDYLHRFEQEGIPEQDFTPFEGATLAGTVIAQWFHEEYRHYPLAERRKRVLARVKRWMEMTIKELPPSTQKSVKRTASAKLRAYEKNWPTFDPLSLYRSFLEAHPRLRATSIERPKQRGARPLVQTEDLAPMLYIYLTLYGVDPRDRFDHVVIDEAQDFSPLQLAVLRMYCPSQSMTILGDLSQSIHTYQGISDWSLFIDQFDRQQCAYYQLDVSYRSTLEIIEFANDVIRPFPQFREAKPVFRSGEQVRMERVAWKSRLEEATDTLHELKQEANTVALLARTEEDACVYHHACLEAGLDAHLIDAKQTEYAGGISILPVYLAKGLEFDSVLIVDADARNYDDTALSAKLLYVGATRALHRLCVQYADEASPLFSRDARAGDRTRG